ncbi:MAG TPA: Asp23/Gls24 family envelope stress response protein [Ktedonobacterales bacterium]|nr:Asp23/Gls24 family envelope stress response protein [Ktedonobacterales bacterium]
MNTWQEGDDGAASIPARRRPGAGRDAVATLSSDDIGIEQLGTVRIARRVLRTVVEQAALSVPGVSGMGDTRAGWPAWLGGPLPRYGVRLAVRANVVDADLYLIAEPGARMVDVGAQVQEAVGAAVEHILGMGVGAINVFIQDIA